MKTTLVPLCLAALLAACAPQGEEAESTSTALNIDRTKVTVSGLSSGAYMAGQLHVAHSSLINGAALLAGGPYGCAEGSLSRAIGACINGGEIAAAALAERARQSVAAGTIDPPSNLGDDRVWLFHGTLDDAVSRDVVLAARDFYREFSGAEQIVVVDRIDVVHGMPTSDYGAACDQMVAPYLNACGYDAAGELLMQLYGELNGRVEARSELQQIDQPGFEEAGLMEHGFVYVPEACRAGAECGLHIAFHGCQQSAEFIGKAFALGAGYNEWAEANGLVVLYPQVASSRIAPVNPLGCWDWWGYTGSAYATRDGLQIAAVMAMTDGLAGAPD